MVQPRRLSASHARCVPGSSVTRAMPSGTCALGSAPLLSGVASYTVTVTPVPSGPLASTCTKPVNVTDAVVPRSALAAGGLDRQARLGVVAPLRSQASVTSPQGVRVAIAVGEKKQPTAPASAPGAPPSRSMHAGPGLPALSQLASASSDK